MAIIIPTLHSARLTLRAFDRADADPLYRLQSDADAMRYWDSSPWSDPNMVERFFASGARMAEEGSGLRLAIERHDGGDFVGWVTFNSWNVDFRSASLGFSLLPEVWGRGYATEAVGAVLDWAFATFDLNRVQAEADTRNVASRRVLEKLGFLCEGTLRQDCVVDGVVSDSWVFGLLRSDRVGQMAAG